MASEVCFISPYPELTALIKESLANLPEPPQIIEGAIEAAEPLAASMEQQGIEAFVTTEGNARHLRSKLNTPVVAIPVSPFDTVCALHRAKILYGQPIALFEFRHPNQHLPAFRDIVGCEIYEYVYHNQEDGLTRLRQAKQDGCRAVVSGGLIASLAQSLGCQCVPIYPGTEAILQAYRQAQEIAHVRQTERREAMKFRSIVQYSFEGIIVVDQDNRITVFNPAAERILGIPAERALGRPVREVIPQSQLPVVTDTGQPQLDQLRTFGRKQLMVNRIPIFDQGKVVGAISTLQEVSRIQSLEEKIRRAAHDSGLTAKMTFQDIVGVSKPMREAIYRAQRFAASDETVLITGETGTGKEIFAQSIHNASARRRHPFVAVNCAAIPPTLLESELFGYADGAFTGARRGGKQGLFELAHRGTIFLDEIGELPREAQLRLLRVLQEKEVMRVGDSRVIPVDVRIIAATNQPLEEALQKGYFRRDLYHRLNVLELRLPPLRERSEDILPLIRAFLRDCCINQDLASRIEAILREQKSLLLSYHWPGNVRELQNLVKRIVALVEPQAENSLEAQISNLLREALGGSTAATPEGIPLTLRGSLKETLEHIERHIIVQQYRQLKGNKTELARTLGIGRTTLWRKLSEAGLE